jgi:lipopolysaccharide/colanic/teichoic acid biosynthesis glycosyltransferase/nucleoside-diphosphate-sugar epimerase
MSKRIFDLILASAALVLTSPVFLVVAILVKVDSRGPILFCPERVGKNGEPFRILKFRTMVHNASFLGPRLTQKRDPRVTRIGLLLRWLKLDELPQLLNVLKGEMSFVGPRPEDAHFVQLYTMEQRTVLSVRPGIVGPRQIRGRDPLESYPDDVETERYYISNVLPEKLQADLEYVRHATLWYDLRVLIRGLTVTLLGSVKPRYFRLNRRKVFFALLDTFLSLGIYLLAWVLKFDWEIPPHRFPYLAVACVVIVLVRPPCFIYFGLYQNILKYLGTTEFVSVVRAVTLGSIFIAATLFGLGLGAHSRAVLVIDWMLLVVVLFGYRLFLKARAERQSQPRIPTLIVGASDMGEDLARALIRNPALPYSPMAFLDDDPLMSGIKIHGIPVMGGIHDLAHVARLKGIRMVLIPYPGSSPNGHLREVVERCCKQRLEYRVLPALDHLLSGSVAVGRMPGTDWDGVVTADGAGSSSSNSVTEVKPATLRRRTEIILVTGGGGFVGSHLVRKLLDLDKRVRVLDSFVYGDHGLRDVADDPRLEIIEGDIRHLGTVARAAKGVTGVIALGALVGDLACELDHDETIATNFESVRLLADVCRRQGVERLVFASSCSVYGANSDLILNEGSWLNPVSLYARTRAQAEEVLLGYAEHFGVVILRLATLFGVSPRMRFDLVVNTLTLHAVLNRKMVVFGGEQWRPNLHVQDAAAAFILALRAPAEKVEKGVFNVGSNENNYTVLQIAKLVKKHVPQAVLELSPDVADQRNYRVAFDKIRVVLGFQPRFTVTDGITEIVRVLGNGQIPDPTAEVYSNYRVLAKQAFGQTTQLDPSAPVGAHGR